MITVDQESEGREAKSSVEWSLRKPYWWSKIEIEQLRCFQVYLLRIDLAFEKNETKETEKCWGGWDGPIFLHRLNEEELKR